ncbi:MAG: FemAB family PEP-CTERM system-associated protein [Gammaproteobacteria bacterium]|nr:FemAB family PEP-CTERM system-associated protein [Gammaproteobacteria bacterium]
MEALYSLESTNDQAEWDQFVLSHPHGSFFHLSGWRDVIRQVFPHRTHFLFTRAAGQISGVLPLAEVRSLLFGHKLVSLPFCVYGGVLGSTADDEAALVTEAGALARRLGVDYLELRQRQALSAMPTVDRYVTFRRRLDGDSEANMRAIPRKQRAMIRKGGAKGLRPVFGSTVRAFFRIYAESLRSLGTPVLPLRYFAALERVFGERCQTLTVGLPGEEPVAAVMSFYFRDEVLPYYGGGTAAARDLHAYDFMYWELLLNALGRGCKLFDFGRSRQGTGSYRFKTHWGFEPEPLHYQYDLVRSKALPNISPDNPRYGTLINVWRRLPLAVTTAIGPWIARDLG